MTLQVIIIFFKKRERSCMYMSIPVKNTYAQFYILNSNHSIALVPV